MEATTRPPRAPGMSPEQRREMIVHAALPLVAEFGSAVTTAQVARAAGIGEATIFRVFADKDALLGACILEALDSTTVLHELHGIPLDQPLAARLVEAVDALRAHFNRIGTVIGALQSSGYKSGRQHRSAPPTGREDSQDAVREAVDELFEPDTADLRLPVRTHTDMFLSLMFGRGRAVADANLSPETLVELFLYGALRSTAGQPDAA
jgi:AcrR family transcriptional regulator